MASATDTNPGAEPRRGEGAEGFPHGSKYPLFVGAGMFFTAVGLVFLPVLVVGVPVLLYGLVGWTWEYAVEEYEAAVVPQQKRQLLGVESGLLGMYILIFSEILVFAGFFVAWFYLDASRGPFPPEGMPAPAILLGGAMAATMLAGSITARYGRNGILRDDRATLVRGFAATAALGLVFLVLVYVEWSGLMAGGLGWEDGPYGAAYYALTGLHAGHLVAGIAMVGIVVYRAASRDHFSERRHLMVKTSEAYWHFLTAISLAIFVFVYFGLN